MTTNLWQWHRENMQKPLKGASNLAREFAEICQHIERKLGLPHMWAKARQTKSMGNMVLRRPEPVLGAKPTGKKLLERCLVMSLRSISSLKIK